MNDSDPDIAEMYYMPLEFIEQWRQIYNETFDTVQMSTNCYAYAWNDRSTINPGYKQEVGYKSKISLARNLQDLMQNAATDGMVFMGTDRPKIRDDFYHACLFVKMAELDKVDDFHWFREDRDGTYSDKAGFNAARNKSNGARFVSMERINYTQYERIGYFYVPRMA